MRLIHLLFFTILIHLPKLNGQDRILKFGLNLNPMHLLRGDYEGLIAIKLSNRFRIKTSLGYTYSTSSNFKFRCKEDDGIEDRLDKGWFNKSSLDYTFLKNKKFEAYSGLGLFYTKFRTSGINRYNNVKIDNGGDITSGGIILGSIVKKYNPVLIDIGIQIFFHDGIKHQVGSDCRGTVPGFGIGIPKPFFSTIYIHVLI